MRVDSGSVNQADLLKVANNEEREIGVFEGVEYYMIKPKEDGRIVDLSK